MHGIARTSRSGSLAELFFFLNPLPQLTTLRGAILEDAIPSTARHGTARGLPLKEVLEYVIPELNIQCLRLAINSPKVPEQLLKLDEQGVSSIEVFSMKRKSRDLC